MVTELKRLLEENKIVFPKSNDCLLCEINKLKTNEIYKLKKARNKYEYLMRGLCMYEWKN